MPPTYSGTARSADGLTFVFDAVGTVLRAQPDVLTVYHELGQRHGVPWTMAELRLRWQAAWSEGMERRAVRDAHGIAGITSQYAERCFWRQFVHQVFGPAANLDALFHDLWDHFAQPRHWALYDDVTPVWEQLVGEGHAVQVASNFDSRLVPISKYWFPTSIVQNVWNSGDIGWRKPSRYFFEHIQRALQLPANRLVYVGDDWRCDIIPAREIGWQAVQIDRGDRPPAGQSTDHAGVATIVIRSLHELLRGITDSHPACCPPAGNYTGIEYGKRP